MIVRVRTHTVGCEAHDVIGHDVCGFCTVCVKYWGQRRNCAQKCKLNVQVFVNIPGIKFQGSAFSGSRITAW